MAFSTQTQLENNVKMIEQTYTVAGDRLAFANERIAFADKIVEVDLSKYITFTGVDETYDIPNLLSQYKAAEMALRRIAGFKRQQNQNDDIESWKEMYDNLKNAIIDGEVEVLDPDGVSIGTGVSTFANTARPEVRPSQGYGKYGRWLNNDDMVIQRGDVDETRIFETID